ncbi:hypothetical protein K440DRAFT_2542 [Wilcoxina mikolae CBS 423.85]|nr:hypothetical protein K440DRAFT_2542 [Wilcoxina mikolae CBS 423.85]
MGVWCFDWLTECGLHVFFWYGVCHWFFFYSTMFSLMTGLVGSYPLPAMENIDLFFFFPLVLTMFCFSHSWKISFVGVLCLGFFSFFSTQELRKCVGYRKLDNPVYIYTLRIRLEGLKLVMHARKRIERCHEMLDGINKI